MLWRLNNQRIAVDYQDKKSKFDNKFFNDVQAELDAIEGLCFRAQPTQSFDVTRRLGSSRAYQAG